MTRKPKPNPNPCCVCDRLTGQTVDRDGVEDGIPLGAVEPCPDCGQLACPDCLAELDCCTILAEHRAEERRLGKRVEAGEPAGLFG